jgi:hypothetical protein
MSVCQEWQHWPILGGNFKEVRAMHSIAHEGTLWVPSNEEEKEMVRQQMNRLLETSHFRNSRRYPPLFRFVVEETLGGRGEFLKERLLGVHVFGRPADYDTASDPIVRVTIAEIRKRIAQYYHEEAHDSEMRIELMPGRYEPEFRPRREHEPEHRQSAVFPVETSVVDERTVEPPSAVADLPLDSESTAASKHARKTMYLVVAAMLVLLPASYLLWQWAHPSAIDEFWGPLLATRRTITFCLPNGAGKSRGLAAAAAATGSTSGNFGSVDGTEATRTPTFLDHESLGENVVFSDALATLRISNLMAVHNRESRFRLNVATTLDDLRQGPSVLIGGLDNEWALRAIAPLRFRFGGSDEESYWIADTKRPDKKDWALDLKKQLGSVNRDYAIIARIHDESTGQPEVIVAGIGMSGTAAAGEFLVDPHQLEELRRSVGPGFRDHDFEAVLSTDVVNGIAGSPKILTTATW